MKICLVYLALVLSAAAIAGCGKWQGSDSGNIAETTTAALPVDSATAGEISGTVVLDGPHPVQSPINMSSEPACAQAGSIAAASREVLTGENGALANVVVFVKSGLGNYRFSTPKEPEILDQKGCIYEPRVVALMVNQLLEVRNDDATIHNVHVMPKANGEWNKAQRAGSPALSVSFPRPELAIPFMCNVHPWMRAFVFVFADPYFAVTTTAGKFALSNLPPGTYTIEAWHEKYGAGSRSVTLGPRESKTVSFRFKAGEASLD